MEKGHFTLQEILSQPEAWSSAMSILKGQCQAVLEFEPARRYEQIVLTGCGSTYYLAVSAASLLQELTGMTARAFPASELWLCPGCSYAKGNALLMAVSRSGETTETLRACESFLERKSGDLLTLSCNPDMPLAKMGKLNIVLPSGQERSVAQTRAFSTLYLGTVALAALWAGRQDLFDSLGRLPQAGARLIETHAATAARIGRDENIDRFYWLGSGPRFGLACELSLKMKEMSLSHSEPFHFLEFRHGPKSMVTNTTLVIGLRSAVNEAAEAAVLKEVMSLGGSILDIGEKAGSMPMGTEGHQVLFSSGFGGSISNILYLPIGQLIAFERSIHKGLDPDRPKNLDSVIRLTKSA